MDRILLCSRLVWKCNQRENSHSEHTQQLFSASHVVPFLLPESFFAKYLRGVDFLEGEAPSLLKDSSAKNKNNLSSSLAYEEQDWIYVWVMIITGSSLGGGFGSGSF